MSARDCSVLNIRVNGAKRKGKPLAAVTHVALLNLTLGAVSGGVTLLTTSVALHGGSLDSLVTVKFAMQKEKKKWEGR